jgi:hypothetical protein
MADKTALQESSQALFCAIADFLGVNESSKILDLKKFNSYLDFKQKNKKLIENSSIRIATPGVNLKMIEEFLVTNNEWYISSLLIANALVKEISNIDTDFKIKAVGFQNLYYFRGDDEVMGNIQKLFTIANESPMTAKKQVSFGNVNKWNPADIYLASDKAKKQFKDTLSKAKPKAFTFSSLNILTSDLIDSGDLLPLSLKKTTSTVTFQRVNFDRKKELETLKKLSVTGVSEWKKYVPVKYPIKGETRDLKVRLSLGGDLKIRHDPSTGKFVAEFVVQGAEARGGGIGSIKIFCELLGFVDSALATKVLNTFKSSEKDYYKKMEPIEKMRVALDKKDPKIFVHKRGEISGLTVVNNVMPILKNWFATKDSKVNDFVRLTFEYVTSRTQLSGKFVIAK